MDPPISNYRPADHLSEQYLLLLKMLIAFQIRLLFLLVLCNTNEEMGFISSCTLKVRCPRQFGSVAGIFRPVVAPWRSISVCVRAQRGPLGEFVFLYLCLSGDFLRQTHTSSL